jgi:hypothetical protein
MALGDHHHARPRQVRQDIDRQRDGHHRTHDHDHQANRDDQQAMAERELNDLIKHSRWKFARHCE